MADILVAPAQLEFLLASGGPKRKLIKGAPGGGKTELLVRRCWKDIAEGPNRIYGFVAPNDDKSKTCLDKFLAIGNQYGWISGAKTLRSGVDVFTANGCTVQFRGARKPSKSSSVPFVGKDWWKAYEDEQAEMSDDVLREVDSRGRVNAAYEVLSSATNEAYHHFQSRLRSYELNPKLCRVMSVDGYSNVFVPRSHWENLKATWATDVFDRYVRGAEMLSEGRAFTMFSRENIRPLPLVRVPVTESLTTGYKMVVGVDFGARTNAASALSAFNVGRKMAWWIRGEFSTNDQPVDWFCEGLIAFMRKRFGLEPNEYLCYADPNDKSGKDADSTDYATARKAGLHLYRAPKLTPRHRISMLNALFHAADGEQRLFIEADDHGRHACPKLAAALTGIGTLPNGLLDPVSKGSDQDLTHYPESVALALASFERIRGQDSVRFIAN